MNERKAGGWRLDPELESGGLESWRLGVEWNDQLVEFSLDGIE